MNNYKAKLFFFLFLLLPINLYAWSAAGHVVVAQIAYDQLTLEKQKKVDQLASIIFTQLPESQQRKLNSQFPNASMFAKTAVLPDLWHNNNLTSLFITFHTLFPLNLLLSLNESTATWHYIDVPFPQNKNCKMDASKNVVWAINNLEMNLAHKQFENSKALELIFLEHYIGDIHQPLHTVTNVSKGCEGDRGGNKFCLKQNGRGKCTKNLHSLWDSAVGYLNPHTDIQNVVYELEKLYPPTYFSNVIKAEDFDAWANESLPNINFVYDTPEFSKPSKMYYQNGQAIAKSQIALAGYRLANEINKIIRD